MKIERRPMMFLNILSKQACGEPNEWPLHARELRNGIIKSNLYPTGPVMFQVGTTDYSIHVPVNEGIDVEGLEGYSFKDVIFYEDGFLFRHTDSEESLEETYEMLRMCAEEYGVKLKEPFYNIYIPIYGEAVIDIYAPIEEVAS